jgi:site-specific DNA-methyltransferase (adenine-specific)
MRQLVAAALPLRSGVILDPFMGCGSTIAAAQALGIRSIGIEINEVYFKVAKKAVPKLANFEVTVNGNGRTANSAENEKRRGSSSHA